MQHWPVEIQITLKISTFKRKRINVAQRDVTRETGEDEGGERTFTITPFHQWNTNTSGIVDRSQGWRCPPPFSRISNNLWSETYGMPVFSSFFVCLNWIHGSSSLADSVGEKRCKFRPFFVTLFGGWDSHVMTPRQKEIFTRSSLNLHSGTRGVKVLSVQTPSPQDVYGGQRVKWMRETSLSGEEQHVG